MPKKKFVLTAAGAAWLALVAGSVVAEELAPIPERYASSEVQETPDFQKHVVPMLGRLGCNGRACHGSFQGRGGFRLSLFGYDFKADHEALLTSESSRVNVASPLESLIIVKPTDEDMHEGGQRYQKDSWEYHVLRRWIEGGAKFDSTQVQKLTALEITPQELQFSDKGQQAQLKAVAVWEDGSREDVTPLCRFQTNDELIAAIDENGLITSHEQGDTHVVVSYDKAVVPIPVIRPLTDLVADKYPQIEAPTKVDELVIEKLRKLGIVPSELCTDAEFLRRVRLDLTGSLPVAKEVEAFLADTDPNKRAKKIDELLETPAYAGWWTTQLCDYTGNNDQNLNNISPLRNRPSQDWYEWIYSRVEQNVPYDQLVEGIVTAQSMKPGQSYREYCEEMSDLYREGRSYGELPGMTHYWSRRDFQNNIEARAIAFAYSFMGIRIQCAQCHKHPFDQWSKDDFHQFKNFFARVQPSNQNAPREYRKEYSQMLADLGVEGRRANELRQKLPELLQEGKTIPFGVLSSTATLQRTRQPDDEYPEFDHGKLLGGEVVDVKAVDDPRTIVMDWLRRADNPYFAKAFVNRVWSSYFNVGIVNPPDDLNLANPPSNRALLDYLAAGFIESGFDMKWVHRTIANSATYQRSWKSNETNELDERNFSHAIPRRLPAEVAYDALQQATASDERVTAMCESNQGRAIALAGASARNNANGDQAFALTVFGRSTRESNCDCDRSAEPSLLQTVFLQNDRSMLSRLDDVRGTWLDQVARELKPPQSDDSQGERRLAGLEKQLETAERQLEKFQESNNERQIAQARRRIAQLQKQLDDGNAQVAKDDAKLSEDAGEKVAQYVIDAYLRTLSRYPHESELARSLAHVNQATDPVDGLSDLLWALVNTKEFIVNH